MLQPCATGRDVLVEVNLVNKILALIHLHLLSPLTRLSENTYMAAIRTGMVSVVTLTIIGGFFMIVTYLPVPGWQTQVAPYQPLLQVPVTATFGLLSVFVCFSIAYDLAKRLQQEPVVSASVATVVFLLVQLQTDPILDTVTLRMEGLGSQGLFTAVVLSLLCVRVQKFFADRQLVIRLPESVPAVVYESFRSLVPLFFLMVVFWLLRFVLGVDIVELVQGVSTLGVCPQHLARKSRLRLSADPALVGRHSWRQRPQRHLHADLSAVSGGQRGSEDGGPIPALYHRLRLLQLVCQRRGNRRHPRAGLGPVLLQGTRLS